MRSFMSSARRRALPVLAAYCVAGAASASADPVVYRYEFNSTTADFDSRFATPAHDPAINTTGGLSGTGAIGRSTGSPAYNYFRTSLGQFDTAGQSATAEYYFFGAANNLGGANDFLGFGTSTTAASPTANTTTAGVKAQIFNNSGTYTNSSLRVETRQLGAGTTTTTADPDTFVLPVDAVAPAPSTRQWFYMTLSLTYNGGSDFSIATSLFNAANDGTVGSLLDRYETTRTGLSSLANRDVYAGFQLFSSGGSPVRGELGDNFRVTSTLTQVPEPAALGLLGITAVALVARRRRTM